MEQKTKCNNAECDFCCDNECLYGGTAKINPNPLTANQCGAFEPVDYFGILIDKMQAEYDAFIEELSHMRPAQIIDKAYEKVFKEDILAAIKDESLLSSEAKALCREEHPLDCVYREWLGNDFSYMDMVRDTIDATVKKLMVGNHRFEWNYTEIKDQASYDALVKYLEDTYTGCNYEQAARLFYHGENKVVMIELQIPTKDMLDCTNEKEIPWLDAYKVENMDDYDASHEIYTGIGSGEVITFDTAEQLMLELAKIA